MKTIEIEISIPVNRGYSTPTILNLIKETLEERFEETDDIGDSEEETVADTHCFGGNTIILTCGQLVAEICL